MDLPPFLCTDLAFALLPGIRPVTVKERNRRADDMGDPDFDHTLLNDSPDPGLVPPADLPDLDSDDDSDDEQSHGTTDSDDDDSDSDDDDDPISDPEFVTVPRPPAMTDREKRLKARQQTRIWNVDIDGASPKKHPPLRHPPREKLQTFATQHKQPDLGHPVPMSTLPVDFDPAHPSSALWETQPGDTVFIKSRLDGEDIVSLANLDPDDLVGRTFLVPPDDNGNRVRARIVERIEQHQNAMEKQPVLTKFRCEVGEEQQEAVFAYGQILQHLEEDLEAEGVWKFDKVLAHKRVSPTHKNYLGSRYNVRILWENGEKTWEPLSSMAVQDPVTLAIYAKEQGLLDTNSWKRFRTIAREQSLMFRTINATKLKSNRHMPKYKYGVQVPNSYKEAVSLDNTNGNTLWQDAVALELSQVKEYEAFKPLGKNIPIPNGYKKITCHLVFDVKHCGKRKARYVAGGHLTSVPNSSVYSGVASQQGQRLVVFIAERNDLTLWGADVGNAYLEAFTEEKLVFIGGPEMGDLEGHLFVIVRALYGLRTSGVRWHERLADVLREMGFFPCKAEADIWMRRLDDHYEYITVYVDDLTIASRDPKAITDTLTNDYKFKLKGTGPLKFHLGMDYWRDAEGTLCTGPAKYIERMIDNYVRTFNCKPKPYSSPLEKNDHPELDTSELLGPEDIQIYQSLVGSIQWAVALCRFDAATACMTLARFRAAPRKGHLERARRTVGYLAKMKHGALRVRTGMPDFSELEGTPEPDWAYSVYGNVNEEIPKDIPEPLGKEVVLWAHVDANLYHCMVTGRACSALLLWANQTLIDWGAYLQTTVEVATYGSEFAAGRRATEQNIVLRNKCRYLGVPIIGPTRIFGDNESVVNSSAAVNAKLHKRHTMLSFHRVREAIAAGIQTYHFIPGNQNPADILSKAWGYTQVWPLMRPILFWQGDTMKALKGMETEDEEGDA